MSLRILSYNIRHGGVNRVKQIAGVINSCEPDVVILQEAERPDVVGQLARACGAKHHGSIYGHSLGFLSRVDIQQHAWHEVPFARRRYLEVVLGSGARIFGVHLSAIHSNLTERRRAYELRALLQGIKQYQNGFHVLTGDFNTLAPGEKLDLDRLPARLQVITWLTGRKIRWHTIQLMLDGGYIDVYRKLHADEGYTFPTWDPHVRLDYLFLPQRYDGAVHSCEIVHNVPGAREASDHFPLLTVITAQ